MDASRSRAREPGPLDEALRGIPCSTRRPADSTPPARRSHQREGVTGLKLAASDLQEELALRGGLRTGGKRKEQRGLYSVDHGVEQKETDGDSQYNRKVSSTAPPLRADELSPNTAIIQKWIYRGVGGAEPLSAPPPTGQAGRRRRKGEEEGAITVPTIYSYFLWIQRHSEEEVEFVVGNLREPLCSQRCIAPCSIWEVLLTWISMS